MVLDYAAIPNVWYLLEVTSAGLVLLRCCVSCSSLPRALVAPVGGANRAAAAQAASLARVDR